ncbi:lipoxygenase, partial [Coprinopsis sp. MPI-PUGE-AT-0042]
MSDHENIKKKRELYQWDCAEGYPPHIKIVPYEDQVNFLRIFSALRVYQFEDVEGDIKEFFGSSKEPKVTMESIQDRYAELAEECKLFPDMYTAPNIGRRPNLDWYTDAVFAQQSFTGLNPIGIRQVSTVKTHDWLSEFRKAAEDQKNGAFLTLLALSPPENFYVVDNSDYRELIGLAADAILVSGADDGGDPSNPINSESGAPPVFGAASVTLYTLDDTGVLHPVAICLDYLGPLGASASAPSNSVTIFNRRTTHTMTYVDESTEWPWRFAKMTASMSDWLRHELTSHLTETHLVEEAIIIAAQRNLPDGHIVYDLLQPHWYKTLSLNVLARSALVPIFIKPIAPIPLEQLMQLIKQTYLDFDFVGRYVPNDLASRGFPIEAPKPDADKPHDGKFHNYLYARGVAETWDVIRGFVSAVLKSAYPNGDSDVKADSHIADFCAEMRRGADAYSALGGAMASFPSPQTLDELIDMVTMCIHIAVPQHNAINYLQQFYLSFIPNRPASFTAPLPSTIDQLKGYTEEHVVAALPINTDADRRQWMGMSQLPYLLSAEVDPDSNMIQYAKEVGESHNKHIKAAAANFEKAVGALDAKFATFNSQMDDQTTPYKVLNPEELARSILI